MGLNIIFAGTPEFAAPALQALIDSEHKVIAAYCQPDRRSGRGRQLQAGAVKALAIAHNIPVFQPETLRDKVEQEMLQALNADLMVVAAYGMLLPEAVLATPRLGCINVHASLLPRWRGAAPIQRAIAAGDKETGITIMQMDKGLDTGPMLNRVSCPIDAEMSAGALTDRLAKLGAETLLMALSDIVAGRTKPIRQDETKATYAKKIEKVEAQIDWQQSADQIARYVRAFNPRPIAFTHIGEEVLRIWEARVISEPHATTVGTIIRADKAGVDIATGDGVLRLLTLQLPGGKALPVSDLLNSKKDLFKVGTVLL